jgi:hypothetical protein
LSPAHQILFARLGVFASGCMLDAAAAVCAADDADLHALAQANLIQITAGIDGDLLERIDLLETLRAFATVRPISSVTWR